MLKAAPVAGRRLPPIIAGRSGKKEFFMLRVLSVAAVGGALMLAACSSGPSWDAPGRTVSTDQANTPNSMNGPMTDNSSSVSAQDKDFVMNAAWGGAFEIQSSRIALQKTQSPRVRMIAQRMIHDHTEMGQQLEAIAQKKGLTASEMPNGDQQTMITKLNNLSGADFDQEYLSQQKTAHEQAIDLFKKESADGSDPDIKFFASNNIPTLETHLRLITTGDTTVMEQK
jgi:putative membrane protein